MIILLLSLFLNLNATCGNIKIGIKNKLLFYSDYVLLHNLNNFKLLEEATETIVASQFFKGYLAGLDQSKKFGSVKDLLKDKKSLNIVYRSLYFIREVGSVKLSNKKDLINVKLNLYLLYILEELKFRGFCELPILE